MHYNYTMDMIEVILEYAKEECNLEKGRIHNRYILVQHMTFFTYLLVVSTQLNVDRVLEVQQNSEGKTFYYIERDFKTGLVRSGRTLYYN